MDKLRMSKLGEIIDYLKENGFKGSYPYSDYNMIQYEAPNGNSFHIYLDGNKPNRVESLWGTKPNTIQGWGLIGEFVGSGKVGRKFSFKTPEDLKNKLNNWVY
jgi:hypothetical protein